MAERSTITQVTQIGVETEAGTAVAARKLLQALSIEPAIKADVRTFRPIGGKYTTIAALGKEWVEAKISGEVACYNHLAYLLAGILNKPTPVKQGATVAYLWTFTPAQTAADTIATFTVEQGSSARAGSFAYGLISSLGLSFSREKIAVSGTMLGQAYKDGITMTATPTAIAVKPIGSAPGVRSSIAVRIARSSARSAKSLSARVTAVRSRSPARSPIATSTEIRRRASRNVRDTG